MKSAYDTTPTQISRPFLKAYIEINPLTGLAQKERPPILPQQISRLPRRPLRLNPTLIVRLRALHFRQRNTEALFTRLIKVLCGAGIQDSSWDLRVRVGTQRKNQLGNEVPDLHDDRVVEVQGGFGVGLFEGVGDWPGVHCVGSVGVLYGGGGVVAVVTWAVGVVGGDAAVGKGVMNG